MDLEVRSRCIDTCNSLLRGEISAVETYGQAISKFESPQRTKPLEQLRASHIVSVRRLSHNVNSIGGHAVKSSGSWGTVANTFQAAANLISYEAAVDSLITGEQHGRKQYETALADPTIPDGCRELILSELLPRTTENTIKLHELQTLP